MPLTKTRFLVLAAALTCAASVGAASSRATAQCTVPSVTTLSITGGEFNTSSDAQGRPSTTASGDTTYSSVICNQAFADDVWDHFYFDEDDWDDGRGFGNFCDVTRMYGRTLVGLWVAMWSSPNAPDTWDDMGGNALAWAANYAAESIDELDAVCSWGPIAKTHAVTGISLDDEWTQIWKGGVYRMTPANRAAMIMHEARHADAEGDGTHNGNDGTPRCPIMVANACDEGFSHNWNTISRANSIQIWYDSWYVVEAVNTTTFQKDQIRANGNSMINNRFDTHPGFNI